jgi:hypothetical protein
MSFIVHVTYISYLPNANITNFSDQKEGFIYLQYNLRDIVN